jgi:hypothetical protein
MYMIRISPTRICYRAYCKAAFTAILHMSSFSLSSDFISSFWRSHLIDNRLSISRITRYMAWCSGEVLWAMFLYVTSNVGVLHGSFGRSDGYCIDMDVAYGENGWNDICRGDAKVLLGTISRETLGTFHGLWGDYGCGLANSIYVDSRFFQFALLLSFCLIIISTK